MGGTGGGEEGQKGTTRVGDGGAWGGAPGVPRASPWERPTVVGTVPLGLGFPLLFHDSRWRSRLVGGDVILIVRCGHKGNSVLTPKYGRLVD